jgi:hypothetical protein
MKLKAEVEKIIKQFETKYPTLKGKAYLTSSNRTWQEQLDIILAPNQQGNYSNIKQDFKAKFGYDKLPTTRLELNDIELEWWERAIMLQAGRSPGFPHVGGMAQDVSVKNLTTTERQQLQAELEPYFGILLEQISDKRSIYGVDITAANLFHLYKK